MSPTIADARAEFPSLGREAYLNAGGAGPFPRPAAVAIEAALRRDLARGRMGAAAIEEAEASVEMLRAEIGALLGGVASEIAITANTTAGQCAVIWGLSWSEGDEVITTAAEHPGLMAPLAVLARRNRVTIRLIPPDEATSDLAVAVARRLASRTRLVALPHVSYATGALLDVGAAANAAREAGAITLVDGAQSVGAIPVDVIAIGVDAYAFPAQKWLCGPEGLGGLWVGPRAAERVDLTFASYESGVAHQPDGTFTPHEAARRYETSTPALSLVPGWRAALAWLGGLGWDWIYGRVAEAQQAVRNALSSIPGVTILTPDGPQAGLLTFRLAGVDARELSRSLARDGVMVRWLVDPPAVRASAGFYTDGSDVERLAIGVAAWAE